MTDIVERSHALCEDCPPVGYPTDETRCLPCPRRTAPAPAAEPQLPPPQGREQSEMSDAALCLATQPPAENSTALPWRLEIWVIYQSGRPFDYRFSRAAGYQRLSELRRGVPSGEWDLNNCDAWLVMQEVTGGDERGVSESQSSHRTQGRESVIECLEEALRPFAERADIFSPNAADSSMVHFRLRHCRAARAALSHSRRVSTRLKSEE